MLGAWMEENKTKDWPAGIKFIQFKKNRALHSGILVTLVVEHLLKEMEGESNDLEKPNLHIEIEESRVELEVDNVTVDAGQLTEYRYENRIVCGQCSTVLLLFGENVNNDGKCLNCERQENIVNERKRSREFLDKQAAKMLKLSNQKFSEVQVELSTGKSVIIGDGRKLNATGVGQIALKAYDGHSYIETTLNNVLHVPELKMNLFSVASAINKGYTMTANHDRCEFIKNKRVCAIAHERLAHQNCKRVKDILKERNIEYTEVDGTCTACLEGKQHRLPFPTSETVTSRSEAARTMIHAKKLDKEMWAEAVNTAVYVLNRSSKSNIQGQTPYEVWTGKSWDDRVEVARKEVEQECATEQNTLTGEDMLNCNEEESEDNKRQEERNRDKDLRETEET
ncbi:hypothetical protein QE152_g39170 [Popillia japonica]|uniref:Retrovirus-related Pol polyprotein from transposon TNT 1-94-like beta-barrel domain-containing protein n=1 Tax=Popillia japonica TaxID=7064 RepID=A0AAW1HVF1_POPJA